MSKTKTAANAFIDLVTPNKPKKSPLGASKDVETLNPFQVAQQNAQRNAALPVEQGGLGLPPNNTAEDRLAAQNYYDYLHGTQRLDRLLEGEGLDPKRATSGPMPYGTDKPELASRYATGKVDTSINDTGKMSDYFQVAPKDLGSRGKNLISVEQSWYHLSPEQQKQILSGYYRTGYANPEEASGAFTLHPEGTQGSIASKDHLDHVLKEERGNPLAALRNLWGESGELYDNPEDLSQIFKVAGYPYDISQTNAPWTTAQGVMLGKARMDNPLLTSDTDNLVNNVIPSLREQFKGDRTRLKVGADQWAKESRYTPNQWLEELEKDVLAGKNSFVWTSIPDKVTGALKKLGHDGIIDLGGKTGGEGHQVVIPFDPTQVRSKFAAFDPMEKSSADLLKAHGGAIRKADGGMVDSVPEEAIKNTVRDPQAARLLDLDLAKYALMNQPQRMMGGGAMKKIAKTVTKPAALSQAEKDANLAKFLENAAVQQRMYHATTKDFDQFDTTKKALMGEGSWFSKEPSNQFAEGEGGNIMPVHLSMKNPKIIEAPIDSFNKQNLINEGFDGVVVTSPIDGSITTAVAFEPTQVKSAIGNRGTYDPNEPSITKAHGGAVRMAQGGQVMSEAIGGQVQTPIQGDMGKMTFDQYRASIGMHEGGRHMAQGGQVQRFKDGGKGEKTGFEEILDLKPNHPSDVKSTSDKPQPKVPAFSVRDLVARIGSDRAKYEELAADPLTPFKNLLPIDAAAVRLLEAANKSGNPERYLETMSPYHDSQLRFNTYDSDSSHPEWGGWVHPDDPRVANVNMHPSGDIIVPHELAHTRQFLSGQIDHKPLLNNPVYDSAKDLPEDVRKNVLWGSNAGDNPMELWANIEAYAHKHNAAGGDFINSPEGRAMFPTPELQREYYTRTIPETSSATPSTGTFVANPPPPPAPVDRSNQSYAQQAMRALGFAEGGQVQRFDDGGEVSQDQMRYELDRANSPVMQATPRSPIQNALGTFGGYMDKAGKFVSEAIAPTAEKHPVKHFLANMLLADSLKGAGTLMQDLTGTAREADEDNPVRGVISKDWKNLTTSREPMLDPRALDLAGFVTPVVKGATKLGQAGVKAITPFAKSTAEMAAELYGSGKMPFTVAPNAYMAEPSAPKPEKILAPANEQGFYSPTEAAALNLQRKTGNGQAFMNDLLKQENVRPDEINAMGLDTFLKDKKNVTAAEVQDYIAQNKLGLGESVYGTSKKQLSKDEWAKQTYPDLYERMQKASDAGDTQAVNFYYETLNREWNAGMGSRTEKTTKFGGHQLPGGENYREVVLTLPDNKRVPTFEEWHEKTHIRPLSELEKQPTLLRMARERYEKEKNNMPKEGNYQSSHWDEPNVLAHLRMSDRVTDGKKTLLVDEVQSDWHQAGRERGYADSNKVTAYDDYAKNLEQRVFEKIQKDFIDDGMDSERASELAKRLTAKVKGTNENLDSMHKLASQLDEESKLKELWDSKTAQEKTVPDAPYKDDWYQLALRRAVKEAIDGGYDRVALPTGDRVNERFSLTKHVDEIGYNQTSKQFFSYKDGNPVVFKDNVQPEELKGIVGKEVAQKLLDAPIEKQTQRGAENIQIKSLKGQDLNIGGEGNRKYYDEIYPNYLKKFGKKYGASVGMTTTNDPARITGGNVPAQYLNEPLHYMDITPAMRKEFSTGIHMAKGGKVSFAKSADDMRKELLRNKHG